MIYTDINEIDKKIESVFKSNKEKAIDILEEIISKMPIEINQIINDAFRFKRIPKEYLLSAIFYAFSNAGGKAFSMQALGYTNYANLYFANIGSRGDCKSEPMELAIKPINEYDSAKFNEYKAACTDNLVENDKLVRQQLLYQNATIEAAVYGHYKNQYSIGIYIDELFFLIEKMAGKSNNEGIAWRTFLLQGNTNKHIDIARKTTESFRIPTSYPTLLGAIQHEFLPKLFADGNLESGLIDRILFTNKLTQNDVLTMQGISNEVLDNYSKSLLNLLKYRIEVQNSADIDSLKIELDTDANIRIFEYTQELIVRKNAANDLSKEYFAKMMINIHKITLLMHLILNSRTQDYETKIKISTVETAILILEFYFLNFKIILDENFKQNEKTPSTEAIIKLAIKNRACQKDVVAITGMDKSSISRKWNRILEQLATDNQVKN